MARSHKRASAGKTRTSEVLPSRMALAQLTGGDAVQRSLSNYAKVTPDGLNTPDRTINQMAERT